MSKIVFSSKIASEFALKTFKFLCKLDDLAGFNSIFSIKKMSGIDAIYLTDKKSSVSLPSICIACDEEELKRRNSPRVRWFSERIELKKSVYYFTNQWTGVEIGKDDRKKQYSIPKLKFLVDKYYPTLEIEISGKEYRLIDKGAVSMKGTPTKIENEFDVKRVITFIKSTGLLYDDKLIKRYTAALLTKPFVILSGLAGSGKTQLSLAFAHALCEDINKQLCFVAVGADWTNREPLLGYPDALNRGEYVKPDNGVLDIIIKAGKDKDKPYFLVLDEMNLSYVERYFADFLSAMESKKEIALWTTDGKDIPKSVALPDNLFVIGTINVDETTYMFSPKVLDRANVIEFKVSEDDMANFLKESRNVDINAVNGKAADMAKDFVNIARSKKVISTEANETLKKFFSVLKKVNAEFGYRTATEIGRFISLAMKDMDVNEAIDAAIVQKLLPKLHGSRKKMVDVLKALFTLCVKSGNNLNLETLSDIDISLYDYPLSADKIMRMYHTAIANGYTSFAEA